MKLRRVFLGLIWTTGAVLALAALTFGLIWWYFHPACFRIDGVNYTQRHGQNLAFDVIHPARTNGLGIVVMVSGGWHSSAPGSFRTFLAAPLLRRGYTLFAVYHLSQPKATVSEIAEDAHRAVRFIRHHASEYGIDPVRIGVTGGSAGGHLSLLLATRGGPGRSDATDPIGQESSAVQAAAVFYPVTDLLNLGASTENLGDGGPPKSFRRAFGPEATNLVVWKGIGRELSPIYYVSSNLPPVLIIHGGADTLVPPDQSTRFQAQAQRLGKPVEVVIRPGKRHGWLMMLWDVRRFGEWFDQQLKRP